MEAWKTIEQFAGYEVSDAGNIRRYLKSGKTRLLKPWKNDQGYQYVSLYSNRKQHNIRIHRLVAIAFVAGQHASTDVVDHIDGDRENNAANNLRWTNASTNNANRGKALLDLIQQICDLRDKNHNPVDILKLIAA